MSSLVCRGRGVAHSRLKATDSVGNLTTKLRAPSVTIAHPACVTKTSSKCFDVLVTG